MSERMETMNGGMEMDAQEMTAQALMQQEEAPLPQMDVDAAPEEEAPQTADMREDGGEGGEQEQTGALPDAEQCRRELAQLALNGFTMEELRAFSEDETVQAAIAGGMSIARAATEYLRRSAAQQHERPARKRAVPNVRTAAGGDRREENSVEQMSDEQFRAFSRRAMEATLAGRRIRLD